MVVILNMKLLDIGVRNALYQEKDIVSPIVLIT